MGASKQPTVAVIQQKFPPELANKAGLVGGNMATAMKAAGCVGLISNGPSRDLDEIRPLKFQYMLSGITPGHGGMAVQAVNVPVSVAGMDVSPGEIIHMDENGAVKFPANRMADVLENVQKLIEHEGTLQERIKKATSAAEIRKAHRGEEYGDEN